MALVFGPVLSQPGDIVGPIDPRHLQAVVYGENRNHGSEHAEHGKQGESSDHALTFQQSGLAILLCRLIPVHWPPQPDRQPVMALSRSRALALYRYRWRSGALHSGCPSTEQQS